MKTKKKILVIALELFNEFGHGDVTTRMIADKVQISLGNLTYHFKKKEDIVFALYLELVEEMSQALYEQETQKMSIKTIFSGTQRMYLSFVKYRFCMIDFVRLMRTNEKIKVHYQALMKMREEQLGNLFNEAIHQNLLLPEEFEGHYQMLVLQMAVYGDYWLSHAEILFEGSLEDACLLYVKGSMMILYPYFTSQSKIEFQKILQDH